MTRTRVLFAVIGLVLIGVLATYGLAATFDTLTAEFTVLSSIDIAITEASVTFDDVAAFGSGAQAPEFVNANAKCNRKDGYRIDAQAADFVGDVTADNLTPTILGFNVVADGAGAPGTPYTYLTAADTDGIIYPTGVKTTGGGTNLDIYMRLNPVGTEAADTYTSTVTFTIVAL